MRRVLLPIDGTARSLKAVDLIKSLYTPEDVSIVLLMVREDTETMYSEEELQKSKAQLKSTLDAVAGQLPGYPVRKQVVFGRAGDQILECAEQDEIDIIVMTKSTKTGLSQKIGSVAAYVVKYAKCIVMIVPENMPREKSAGNVLKCRHMDDIVTLSGQMSFRSSSCLLPVQAGKCVYSITVLEGKLRLNHSAYDPDGGTWSAPPRNGQPEHYDLKKGEEREIRLEAGIAFRQLDQIEVVNPSMTSLLKFHYIARFESLEE